MPQRIGRGPRPSSRWLWIATPAKAGAHALADRCKLSTIERTTMGNAASIPAFSAANYLVWEEQQTERHMFVRGEVFDMSGGTAEHNEATINAALLLKQQLKGTP